MFYKKINARITKSWSSYAASAFGVITDCGMWELDKEWYGLFMGLTGICFQTIYDKNAMRLLLLRMIGKKNTLIFCNE